MNKTILFTFVAVICTIKVNAQNSFSQLIKSTPSDATKLLNAYAEPIFKGFGIGMNSGWNNTAKTKGLFHFDLRVTATAAFVSATDKSFDVTKIGLSNNIRPSDATKTITPTAGGSTSNGPYMQLYDDNGNKINGQSFPLPGGVSPAFGSPQLQATIGLPYNTDVTIRAIPKINYGSSVGQVSMLGGGIKHNIMPDIFGKASAIVPFDLALAVNYSHLDYSLPVDVKPYNSAKPKDAQQSTDFTNQQFTGHFKALNVQAIFSKKLAFFTPYVSVCYSTCTSNVALEGNYPLTTGIDNIITRNPTYTSFTNPININERTINGAQGEAGFQLSLPVFRFYASYVMAQYQSINAGIGFGF